MVRTRFALKLYFCMAAHTSACYTLLKAFAKRHGRNYVDVVGTFKTGF